MGKDYDGKDRRAQNNRRCCDLDRDMTEKSINNWLRFVGLLLLLITMGVSYSAYFFNGISKNSDGQITLQKNIDLNISKVLLQMATDRLQTRTNTNELKHHGTRITQLEVGVSTVQTDLNSHKTDDFFILKTP